MNENTFVTVGGVLTTTSETQVMHVFDPSSPNGAGPQGIAVIPIFMDGSAFTALDEAPVDFASSLHSKYTNDGPASSMSSPHVQRGRANLDGRIDDMYRLAYRMSFRLLGVSVSADRVASEAIRSIAGSPNLEISESTLVLLVLEALRTHHEALIDTRDSGLPITHLVQRKRLWRDIKRWDDQGAQILMLRHLGVRPVQTVSDTLAVDIERVRHVASSWDPADATAGYTSMLSGLDSWIPTSLNGSAGTAPTINDRLAHLDDPGQIPHQVRSISDLRAEPLDRGLSSDISMRARDSRSFIRRGRS